jgi:hypothetical protein
MLLYGGEAAFVELWSSWEIEVVLDDVGRLWTC